MVLYLNKFESSLRKQQGSGNIETHLIWGDPVEVVREEGEYALCRGRDHEGWIKKAELSKEGLLEIYIIDVGQGDSVLVRTPDEKWHIVDGGNAIEQQMTRKSAANFLRWKFQDDLGIKTVTLENVILTHPDLDHYGGLMDIFLGDLRDGRKFPVVVNNFYHSGIGKFEDSPKLGTTVSGQAGPFPKGNHGIDEDGDFIVELLDGRDSFGSPPRPLDKNIKCQKKSICFDDFAKLVASVPKNVRRISHKDTYLPGYRRGENEVTMKVLAPFVEKTRSGTEGLRDYKDEGETINGNSVVLRLDYGNARIFLTGDLNEKAEKLLLSYVDPAELSADILKACHHGTDIVSYEFLNAVKPRATVISSGDNELYAHPRPVAMGAVGRYGRDSKSPENKTYPPMLYSTELARSVELDHASGVQVREQGDQFRNVDVKDAKVTAKDWNKKYRTFTEAYLSTGLTYGLVNIRTDGRHILCGTRKESAKDFDCRVFQAGVDA
jgi:hypothetical protein